MVLMRFIRRLSRPKDAFPIVAESPPLAFATTSEDGCRIHIVIGGVHTRSAPLTANQAVCLIENIAAGLRCLI